MVDTTITLTAGQWTLLTSTDVTAVSLQNQTGYTIEIKATVGAVAPTARNGARHIRPYKGLTSDLLLSQVWPGVVGANRVYGYCDCAANVAVSHA